MPGNQTGGYKAAAKNKAHDPLHYIKIGRAGGFKSRGGGFAKADHDKVVEWGRRGGAASRRTADSDKTVQCDQCYRKYVSTASRNSHVSRKHAIQ